MPDLRVLKAHKVSARDYKKIWTLEPNEMPKPVQRLRDLISSRIKDGRTWGLKEWRAIQAIDLAYEAPFNQTTPTIVQHILSKNLSEADALAELREWGLKPEEMFILVKPDKGDPFYTIDPPVFFQVVIPLVKAYCTMRLANLFNQRNTNPFLLYQPLKMHEHDQVLCEIVTDMVNTVSTWYGYPAFLRQMLQSMLKYGNSIAFPREEWHCEKELVWDDETKAEKKQIIKEGIRYFDAHPTRRFHDLKYPLTSINTDSGIEYLGAWRVLSYGEIIDNRYYYNRQKLFCGTNWFEMPGVGQYFKEVYPCSMKFPTTGYNTITREDRAAWYNSGERDQMVFVTEYFQKLIPKQFGLADYDYPVWHRFTVAGDDTVIWCSPCAYNPCFFMGWDYDENASRNSSMALECIPWQDTLGNILSQMILTAKQNLMDVTWYDNQQVNKGDIDKLRNMGESKYRSKIFIGFDGLKARMAGHNPQAAFFNPQFTKQPIQELLQLIPTCLGIMERVLQITAQESGAAASHQQSKEEVKKTGEASGNRVMLTFSAVDEGIDAWKTQQFDANMAYREDNTEVQVSSDIPDVEKILEELGFKIVRKGKDVTIVKVSKTKLRLVEFARTSQGSPLQGDKEVAQTIFQTVGTVAGQEDLRKRIGAKNLLAMIEYAAKLAGAPRDFRLRMVSEEEAAKDEQPPENILQAIQQAQQATMQVVEEKIAKPAAEEMHKVQTEVQQLQGIVAQLQKIYEVAAAAQDKTKIKAAETAQKLQQRQQAFQAEEARKQQAHQQEMQQTAEKANLQLQIDAAKGAAKADAAKKE